MTPMINVSNRLPVTIKDRIVPSSGGLVSALEGYRSENDFKWIGWSGGPVENRERRDRITEDLKRRFNYVPLFIAPEDIQAYYTGFANSSLWPLLHYLPSYAQFNSKWTAAYEKVNALFARTVARHAPPGALVWVHDYHLMLVPGLLRELRDDLRIGFFLHTPFPSYEIFRCLPNRRQVLEKLLGADLIGFHTSGYMRHFRSTVLRVLGHESEINTIPLADHDVNLGIYPISVPANKFLEQMKSEAYTAYLKEYRSLYAGRKVVLSVERLDYTKGVPRRLGAIERFLERSGRKDVVFIFINVPSRESVAAYRDLRRRIEHKVSQINGTYADIHTIPVHFIHQSVNFAQLCALYSLADVAMVTPLIDGMNLVAKEYLVCKPEGDGVLILSEFAGAAQELYHASLVNPYDIDQMAQTLEEALDRPAARKRKRLAPMRKRVLRYNAQRWAQEFIRDLGNVQKLPTEDNHTPLIQPPRFMELVNEHRLALFVDYDGTLTDLRSNPLDAEPDAALRELFDQVARTPGVTFFLLSGRLREEMDQWFDGYGFYLVAEQGFYYRPPDANDWQAYEVPLDMQWKQGAREILVHYEDMTPGASVEEKAASLNWHYANADPEFGAWKARQLMEELQGMFSNLPVELHHDRKTVEIFSVFVNKSAVVQYLRTTHPIERAVYAGDDHTDEAMFRTAEEHDITIKIGAGESEARFRLPTPNALRRLLAAFLENRQNLHYLPGQSEDDAEGARR